MKSLHINIPNNTLAQKVILLLEHFKDDGIEIIQSDMQKNEEHPKSIDFGEYKVKSFADFDGLTYQHKLRDEWL